MTYIINQRALPSNKTSIWLFSLIPFWNISLSSLLAGKKITSQLSSYLILENFSLLTKHPEWSYKKLSHSGTSMIKNPQCLFISLRVRVKSLKLIFKIPLDLPQTVFLGTSFCFLFFPPFLSQLHPHWAPHGLVLQSVLLLHSFTSLKTSLQSCYLGSPLTHLLNF